MATNWFYYIGDQRIGPVGSQQLKDLAKSGEVQPDNLVWKEGMPKPQPASKVKGLFEPQSTTPIEETEPPAASDAEVGDSAADAGTILAELGHAIRKDALNIRRAVFKHLQPTVKPARQFSESTTVETVGQTKQPGFVESLKTAGTLAAKQADLARIKNVSLSAALQKLGKSVFEGNIGRAELKAEYAALDDLRYQITARAEIAKKATAPQGFAEQAKAMAKATADAAQTKMLQMRLAQAITRLGTAAYEHRAEIALPQPLIDGIDAIHLQISQLEADIQTLCEENPDQKLGTSLADNPLIHLLAIPLCGLGFVLVFRSSYWSRKAKYRWAAGLIGFWIVGAIGQLTKTNSITEDYLPHKTGATATYNIAIPGVGISKNVWSFDRNGRISSSATLIGHNGQRVSLPDTDPDTRVVQNGYVGLVVGGKDGGYFIDCLKLGAQKGDKWDKDGVKYHFVEHGTYISPFDQKPRSTITVTKELPPLPTGAMITLTSVYAKGLGLITRDGDTPAGTTHWELDDHPMKNATDAEWAFYK